MTNTQENQRSMFLATQKVCEDNQTVWNASVTFTALFNFFMGLLGLLEKQRMTQEQSTLGITQDKAAAKEKLVADALVIAAGIKNFAADNNDNELYESVNYKKSRLEKSRDTLIVDRCKIIRDAASANAAALIPYGISAGMITAFTTDIDSYAIVEQKPRAAKSTTKNATTQIRKLVKQINAHLDRKMDNSVLQFTTAPDFISQYSNARIVIDLTGASTGVKGTIKDKATGLRLKNVKVTIVEIDSMHPSNTRGNYSFKKMQEGKYTLQAELPGYQTFIINGVEVPSGKQIDLDIELVKK